MGGNVWVKSKIGVGSVFKIEMTTLCKLNEQYFQKESENSSGNR